VFWCVDGILQLSYFISYTHGDDINTEQMLLFSFITHTSKHLHFTFVLFLLHLLTLSSSSLSCQFIFLTFFHLMFPLLRILPEMHCFLSSHASPFLVAHTRFALRV
jgi:hypothetical protein